MGRSGAIRGKSVCLGTQRRDKAGKKTGRKDGQEMRAFLAGVVALLMAGAAAGQELAALAQVDAGRSRIAADGAAVTVELQISQPVPWRVRLLDQPPRLVLDMREVDWRGVDGIVPPDGRVRGVRAGVLRPGWSRLVVELDGPYRIAVSAMETAEAGARVAIRLERTTAGAFAAEAGRPEPPEWTLPPARTPAPVEGGTGPLVVVLDPGHGGIDPGAERDGLAEADLMLAFAREMKEALLRGGGVAVVLTREDDVFVPLEARTSIARAVGADLFISLHADALAEGEAAGATLYTLADEASDAASAALAERHDRDDLLAGVDLTAQDDVVATVLMDMARRATAPQTDRLAGALETAIRAAGIGMHPVPRQEAAFSVLKSPDVPSVLIELGFLSSAGDRARLADPDWRARMAAALAAGVRAWADDEAARVSLAEP